MIYFRTIHLRLRLRNPLLEWLRQFHFFYVFPGKFCSGQLRGNDPIARYDLFAMQLKYYNGDGNLLSPQGYGNGNIAAQYWQVAGRDRQAFGYRYDELDRLKFSYYGEITNAGTYYNKGIYQEGVLGTNGLIQYDNIGNILSLKRYGISGECTINGAVFNDYGPIDEHLQCGQVAPDKRHRRRNGRCRAAGLRGSGRHLRLRLQWQPNLR